VLKLLYTGLAHTGSDDAAGVSSFRVYARDQPEYMKGPYTIKGTVCVKGRIVEFLVSDLRAEQVFAELERFRQQCEKLDPIPF
jgi:hypothetical protein